MALPISTPASRQAPRNRSPRPNKIAAEAGVTDTTFFTERASPGLVDDEAESLLSARSRRANEENAVAIFSDGSPEIAWIDLGADSHRIN